MEEPPNSTNTYHPYYFVATAWNSDLESDYSECLVYTPTNYIINISLAWDSVTNATSYTVYYGRYTNVYNKSIDAHSNTCVTIQLQQPSKTNVTLTITTSNATNIAYSTNMKNWTMLNVTNKTYTNPPSPMFVKPKGNSSSIFVNKTVN